MDRQADRRRYRLLGSRHQHTVEEPVRHQYEVSVLRRPVLVGQLQDVSLLDELVGWVDDVFFSAQQLVDLQ